MAHLTEPRIPPARDDEVEGEAREILEPQRQNGRVLNIFRTLIRHPKLMKRWLVFANHILLKSSLPARDREILILRAGWLARSEYEWGQHVIIGRRSGLSDEEIDRLRAGPDAAGWSELDAALVRAADELHADSFVSDATWKTLASRYSTEQLMDVVFTVGQYTMLAMALNSFGVQLDEGIAGFPSTRG